MQTITLNLDAALVLAVIAGLAWLIRLEARVKANEKTLTTVLRQNKAVLLSLVRIQEALKIPVPQELIESASSAAEPEKV